MWILDGAITGGNIEVTGSNKVGNEITVASKKASIETEYVLITLNEALKAGDVTITVASVERPDIKATIIVHVVDAIVDVNKEPVDQSVAESRG